MFSSFLVNFMSLNVPIMFVLMKKCMQHYTYFTNYLIQWLWTLCAPETLHKILYTRLYTSIRRACTQDIWCAQAFIFYTGAVANKVCSIHRQIYNLFKPAYMPFIENRGMDIDIIVNKHDIMIAPWRTTVRNSSVMVSFW